MICNECDQSICPAFSAKPCRCTCHPTYCACCGGRLGSVADHHIDEPCPCPTCKGSPNHCTECGRFIGSKESSYRHQREATCPTTR